MSPEITVIVPCFEEERYIGKTIDELTATLRAAGSSFEVIVIDDGSRDGSWQAIDVCAEKHPEVIGIRQMANFGQTQAYQAGFAEARGTYVLTFSGDGETPATAVLDVIQLLREGRYDFVNSRRRGHTREERRRPLLSRTANGLINRVSGLSITDRGSGLKGMIAPIAKSLRLSAESHRFIPDYVSLYTGADRIGELEVPYAEPEGKRAGGRHSWRSLKVLLDITTLMFLLRSLRKPFLLVPGRVFGFVGLVVFVAGFVVSVRLIILRVLERVALTESPIFFVAVLATILGVIMAMLGMLGELLLHVHQSTRPDATYLIRERAGHPEARKTPDVPG